MFDINDLDLLHILLFCFALSCKDPTNTPLSLKASGYVLFFQGTVMP